ncbi:MAG: Uma2 family endonuclease, partial [Nostoc sp.]
QGVYQNVELPWLRWWDLQGNLLLSGDKRAEQERQRADRLTAQLRRRGAACR